MIGKVAPTAAGSPLAAAMCAATDQPLIEGGLGNGVMNLGIQMEIPPTPHATLSASKALRSFQARCGARGGYPEARHLTNEPRQLFGPRRTNVYFTLRASNCQATTRY
jgi:hypothetical protein